MVEPTYFSDFLLDDSEVYDIAVIMYSFSEYFDSQLVVVIDYCLKVTRS